VANAPDICPVCGVVVPTNARACPECGSDEQTGWSEKARSDDLGIPDDSFDYDDFVEREFQGKEPKQKHRWLWIAVAVILLLSLVIFFVR
jgi:hypothetical protein